MANIRFALGGMNPVAIHLQRFVATTTPTIIRIELAPQPPALKLIDLDLTKLKQT
jgi:hypothetical protein